MLDLIDRNVPVDKDRERESQVFAMAADWNGNTIAMLRLVGNQAGQVSESSRGFENIMSFNMKSGAAPILKGHLKRTLLKVLLKGLV